MADPFASLGFIPDREQPAPAAGDPFAGLGFIPDREQPAPAGPSAASQSDVRWSEPAPPGPMDAFNAKFDAFDKMIQRFQAETGGALKPGQNVRQATAEWSGIADPAPEQAMAEIEEVAQGGKLQYGNSLPYAAAKTLASMGGFAVGGPAGATGAESMVRFVALTKGLERALDAGAIDYDRAASILAKEMASGATEDLAWNVAVPLLGQVLGQVPGARKLIVKVASKLKGAPLAADADLVAQRAAKVASRVDDAATPAAKQAVKDLSERIGGEGHVLTPGQVTGETGFGEKVARAASPDTFAKQEGALQAAGEGIREKMLGVTLDPAAPSLREGIGNTIQTLADETQKALKTRLRPVFQNADNLGVKVDFSDVLTQAKLAAAADATVPGGRLLPRERADLEQLVAALEGKSQYGLLSNSQLSAEAALDFISRQKEKIRAVTADYKPSSFYETIVNRLTKSADSAFGAAAARAGKPEVATALKAAQSQYRVMMETVYDDAVKQALKKNPEDVGRLFWQGGNVSEPKQLRRLRALAMGEGAMGEGLAATKAAQEQTRSMIRGFLQEGVPNIDTAARWSTMLREKPGLRDTWNTLTAAPGGAELRAAMEVLEEAAKIAGRGSAPINVGGVPVKRAMSGGLGVSYVTGALHPGMLATGVALGGTMKLMATAYSQGNKGILNMVARALRAQNAGTAAGAKAAQAAYPVLEEYAAAHGITDLFSGKSTEGQPSEPEPQ